MWIYSLDGFELHVAETKIKPKSKQRVWKKYTENVRGDFFGDVGY